MTLEEMESAIESLLLHGDLMRRRREQSIRESERALAESRRLMEERMACECGGKAVMKVTVTDLDGVIQDGPTELCADCYESDIPMRDVVAVASSVLKGGA